MAGLGAAHALETARRAAAAAVTPGADPAAAELPAAAESARPPGAPPAAAPPFDWILFERADYLGGKVRTERIDGFVIEGGPDSFIVEKPWPMELARAVGIYDRLLDSNEDIRKSYVYSGGRLHELPEGLILMVPTRLVPFAVSSLVSWRGKLRMGLDLRAAARPRWRRREPRRVRAAAAGERGAGQDSRADRGRHPRRRSRADERAGYLSDVPRDGAPVPQPDRRHDPQAAGAGAGVRPAQAQCARRRVRLRPRPTAPTLAARAPTFCPFGPDSATWPTRWSPTCRPTTCTCVWASTP